MITRWNPLRDMYAINDTIDKMFDDAWRPFYENTIAMDIDESETGYTISAAVPGVNADDIQVRVQDNVLTVSGESKQEQTQTDKDGKRIIMRERRYGRFSRSVRLSELVDADNIEATYENGVLKLTVPKAEAAQPERIPVHAG